LRQSCQFEMFWRVCMHCCVLASMVDLGGCFSGFLPTSSPGHLKHGLSRRAESFLRDPSDSFKGRMTFRLSQLRCTSELASTQRVQIGTLEVSSIGTGAMNWPLNKESDPGAEAAFSACFRNGINLFDTAEAYGFGTSEKLVRTCIQSSKTGESAKIATKFAPVPWRQDASDVVDACKASAERLGVDSIDLYQIHWPDIIQPFKPFGLDRRKDEIFWDGIAQCYEQGLAKNIGVSNYGPELLSKAHKALSERGVPLVSNQINFSLLCRKQGNQATVDRCKELGVQPIGYFPLASGLLAGRYSADSMPPGLKGLTMKKYIIGGEDKRSGTTFPPGGVSPLIEEMRGIAEARGKTVPQIALNYVVCKGVVPIPGCRSAEQARENAGAMGWRMTEDEVSRLEAAADALGFEFSNGGFNLTE